MHKQAKQVELRLSNFLRGYARKRQKNHDPNDRHYDRKQEARIKRMTPELLDRLMRGEIGDE